MDFLKSLSNNHLPEAPTSLTPKKDTKASVPAKRASTQQPSFRAIRANVGRRGQADVLASLESVYGTDLAAAHLAKAMALNPGAVEAVRQRTKHPVNFDPTPSPSFADSQAFQNRYYANQRRDNTVSNMAKYPDSAPMLSSMFKMGGGSFDPIQRQPRQHQSNPFYQPSPNQGSRPMGGGSRPTTTDADGVMWESLVSDSDRARQERAQMMYNEQNPDSPLPFSAFLDARIGYPG